MKPSQLFALIISLTFGASAFAEVTHAPAECEQWGVYELQLEGPTSGNPFSEHLVSARFTHADQTTIVRGFYDGEGKYLIRFMPSLPGEWTFATNSSDAELDAHAGAFVVKPPSAGNHGPVQVANMFHFAYADGTPYKPLGTTCYAWTLAAGRAPGTNAENARERRRSTNCGCASFPSVTIGTRTSRRSTLSRERRPTSGISRGSTRHSSAHSKQRIARLGKLGIEADLILLHPVRRRALGFRPDAGRCDDRYLQYVVARLAAYRNVWWSMANEWDFMLEKQPERLGPHDPRGA